MTGGIVCTFPMGLSFLAAILSRAAQGPSRLLYLGAIGLHLFFLLSYVRRFAGKPLSSFYTPAFLVFVGPAAWAVTAPAFSMQLFGRGILFVTGAAPGILYPALLYRKRAFPIPEAQRPPGRDLRRTDPSVSDGISAVCGSDPLLPLCLPSRC